MHKPVYNFAAPQFSGRNLENCCLAVSVAENSFSLLLQNQNGQVIRLNKATLNGNNAQNNSVSAFIQYMENFPWVNKPMKKKVAVMDTDRFTLVPFSLYDNAQKKCYLELNHPTEDNDRIRDDMLKNHYAYLLYAQSQDLKQAVESEIPGILWRHHATVIINYLDEKYKIENGIVVDVRDNRFYLMAMQNSRLKFCNSFSYQSREAFAYFVLLVYKQLDMSAQEVPLRMLGLIHKDSGVVQLLKRYIKNITFGDESVVYQDEEMDQPCRAGHFETLKTAAACE